MLEDGVGVHNVEGLVSEGKRASIESDGLHAGKAVPVIENIREGDAASDDARAVLIRRFQLLRQPDTGSRRSYIQDAGCCRRTEQLQEELMPSLARLAVQIQEQAIHRFFCLVLDSIAWPDSACLQPAEAERPATVDVLGQHEMPLLTWPGALQSEFAIVVVAGCKTECAVAVVARALTVN